MPKKTPLKDQKAIAKIFPDADILYFFKGASGARREFKWVDSNRYGVINLHAADCEELQKKFLDICSHHGWQPDNSDFCSKASL